MARWCSAGSRQEGAGSTRHLQHMAAVWGMPPSTPTSFFNYSLHFKTYFILTILNHFIWISFYTCIYFLYQYVYIVCNMYTYGQYIICTVYKRKYIPGMLLVQVCVCVSFFNYNLCFKTRGHYDPENESFSSEKTRANTGCFGNFNYFKKKKMVQKQEFQPFPQRVSFPACLPFSTHEGSVKKDEFSSQGC